MQHSLILGSSSRYRKELLTRLGIPFRSISPDIDESALDGETALQTCSRLARLKAQAILADHQGSIVIGSDQVVDLDGIAVSKPGSHEAAVRQLTQMSGRTLTFHSAVCVCSEHHLTEWVVPTVVQFRRLDPQTIERYLRIEEPYDCAGSAKSEGLGISLLEKMTSDDPTALIGLPLITLSAVLRKFGLQIP